MILARRTALASRGVSAFPNPFTSSTTVAFAPRTGAANSTAAPVPVRSVRVIDVRGRIVRHAEVAANADGGAEWRWDGRDDHGVALSRGSYFLAVDGWTGTAERIVLSY